MDMSKRILIGSLIAGMAATAQATHLTPEEALLKYQQENITTSRSLRAPSSNTLQLVYTNTNPEESSIYVFAPEKSTGFVMLAADDAIGDLVLGYSQSDVFDPNNIPPALQWLMECYAETIEKAAAQPGTILRIAKAAQKSIAPLIKTKWDQTNPYNNQCPILEGRRSVTGCVATALAQIMNYHKWPAEAVGSTSYTYTYNGNEYEESFDFNELVLDWDNMTDTYDSHSTAEQKQAVAALMHAIGAASKMSYGLESTGGSSANNGVAAQGLTEFFDYDKGMTYCHRNCYSKDEWDDLLYSQLSQGLPVLYSGSKISGAGHAFICDGYDNGLYHINWGWGGHSDSYYDLSILHPTTQGAGAGSGDGGYSYNEAMVINIQPQKDNESTPMMGAANFYTPDYSFNRNSSTAVPFIGPFMSLCTKAYTFELGIELVQNGKSTFISSKALGNFAPSSNINTYNILSSNLPVGSYEAYPAFKETNGKWTRMKFDVTNPNFPLKMTVSANAVNIQKPDNAQGTITSEFISSTPLDPNDEEFYSLHTYDFTWAITAKGDWNQDVSCALLYNNTIYGLSDIQRITINDGQTKNATFRLEIPNYQSNAFVVALIYSNNTGTHMVKDSYPIKVTTLPTSGDATWTDITFVGSLNDGQNPYAPAKLYSSNCAIQLTISCTSAPLEREIAIAFAPTDAMSIIGTSEYQHVKLSEKEETTTLTFKGPWSCLSSDQTYRVAVLSDLGQMYPYSLRYFTMYDGDPKAEILTIDQTSVKLLVEDTYQLTTTVLPEIAVYDPIQWTSSDEEVATVVNGLITGMNQGSATITVTCGDLERTCYVYVDKHSQSIEWDQDFSEIYDESEIELQAKATSELPVTYNLTEGHEIAELNDATLRLLSSGTVTIEASQEGDWKHHEAIPVTKSFFVIAGIESVYNDAVTVEVEGSTLTIHGLDDNETVSVYLPSGLQVYCGKSHQINLMPNTLYLLKVNNRVVKFATR